MASNSATPASAPNPHEEAKTAWHYTRKERQNLSRQLAKARESTASGVDITHFDRIDESISRLRLNCVSVIFLDFEYAVQEQVEELLWLSHVDVNNHFRRTLDKSRSESRHVEKRKVEAKQGHFLRISQKFYKGFIKQLSQCYVIPELRRVAREIDAEGTSDHSVTPSPELAQKVLSSCHLTLIRLGDLGRYRVDAKSSKTYSSALVCYSLAHDLIPDSGFAFHQIAIINVQDQNHLEIVYNFYRSLAVKDPHPSAKENLEKKFDSLQSSRASKKGRAPPTASEALILWFVKLHAVFYKGEVVDENHTALEREVMHRLSLAVKDPNLGILLLRMALINISASCVAFNEYTESPTDKASNSYKYTLHFNARFIHQISEATQSDAREASRQPSPNAEESNATKSSVTEALLPVLRIYSMWIASQKFELFGSAHSPTNVVPTMTKSLARVWTIFCAEITDAREDGLASCPYLLPEDREIRGLTTLKEDQVPSAAQCYATDLGELKPYMLDGERWDATRECSGRKLDILRCAYHLSEEETAPIILSHKGDNELEFQYQEAQSSLDHSQTRGVESSAAVPATQLNGHGSNMAAPHAATQPENKPPPVMRSPQKQSTGANDHQAQEMEQTHATVLDMLSPFLDSPLTDAERTKQSREETSYGMHSNTAHELAQELLQSFDGKGESAPYYASVSPGSFASSPYGQYFNPRSPNVQASVAAGQVAQQANHRRTDSSRSVSATNNSNDVFATPSRNNAGLQPQMPGSGRSPHVSPPGAIGTVGQPLASNGGYSYAHPRSVSRDWQQEYQAPGGSQSMREGQGMPPPASNFFSSGTSAFSNLSSVYQGTPAKGLAFQMPARGSSQQQKQSTPSAASAHPMYGQTGHGQTQSGGAQPYDTGYSMYGNFGANSSQTNKSPSAASPYAMYGNFGNASSNSKAGSGQGIASRPYQTSNSASSYDAQVFEAAMRGNK